MERMDKPSTRPAYLARILVAGAASALLAACATPAQKQAAADATSAKKPLFGFRVLARPLAEVPGYLQVVASHRSRDYTIEKLVVLGPRGRVLKPVSVFNDRIQPRSARVWGRPGVGVGVGTGGVGIGIGAPLNFDALLDSIVLPERSSWRRRTLATVRLSPAALVASPGNRWRVRVTLTDRQGAVVHREGPLILMERARYRY